MASTYHRPLIGPFAVPGRDFRVRETDSGVTMEKESLEYLAQRLEAVAKGDFCEAAILVRKVMASTSTRLTHPDAEHALYHAVWDYVSQALDHNDYDPANELAVNALESEMAGRTLYHRMVRGWLRSTESAPTDFRGIDEFL